MFHCLYKLNFLHCAFYLGWGGSNGGFLLSFLLSFGVSASMFCQDDIKIARETHYGSLYIDTNGHKHLGSKFKKSQIDRSSGIGLDTNVLSTGTIQ